MLSDSSSFEITLLSLIISGRVPTTVITFSDLLLMICDFGLETFFCAIFYSYQYLKILIADYLFLTEFIEPFSIITYYLQLKANSSKLTAIRPLHNMYLHHP